MTPVVVRSEHYGNTVGIIHKVINGRLLVELPYMPPLRVEVDIDFELELPAAFPCAFRARVEGWHERRNGDGVVHFVELAVIGSIGDQPAEQVH